MSLRFACERCGQVYETAAGAIGRGLECRICGLIQRIEGAVYELAPVPVQVPAADSAVSLRTESCVAEPRPVLGFWPDLVRAAGYESSRIAGLTLVLIVLSGLDLLMTFTLLGISPTFYESNPVAQFFFQRWNMAGMALFKFGVIGAVVAMGELIERRRPGWGQFVLAVGCVGAIVAIVQGMRLYMGHQPGLDF